MTRIAVLDADKCKPKKCNQAMHKILPHGPKPSGSHPLRRQQNRNLRETLQRLRHMRQEMPVQSHQHRQPARRVGEGLQSPFWRKCVSNFSGYPCLRQAQCLGLLGQNGIGKSTTLKVLSGEIKPNLGNFQNPPEWNKIIQFYRGSSLQDYFQKMSEGQPQSQPQTSVRGQNSESHPWQSQRNPRKSGPAQSAR